MGTLESESVQGRVVAVLITVVLTPLPKLQSCLRRRCCTQFFYGPSILLHRFSWFYCHSLAATPLRNGCIIAIPRRFSWAVETLNCPWVADWYITGDETWLDGCNWIFHLTIWNCRWWEHSHQFIDFNFIDWSTLLVGDLKLSPFKWPFAKQILLTWGLSKLMPRVTAAPTLVQHWECYECSEYSIFPDFGKHWLDSGQILNSIIDSKVMMVLL